MIYDAYGNEFKRAVGFARALAPVGQHKTDLVSGSFVCLQNDEDENEPAELAGNSASTEAPAASR